MIKRIACVCALALCLPVLVACSPAGHGDLMQWMGDQRAGMRPRVTPLAEPKKYEPQEYTEAVAADPFGVERLAQALRRESGIVGSGAALIAPELNRRKEPLEVYPLDVMSMVGNLNQGGQKVALVRIDKLLHQVRPGQYLGMNYGKVVDITESRVLLREIVQDAAGEWIERSAELQLQEKKQ